MTALPETTDKTLGLVIDLDTCVGCHACVIACKGWNTENYGAPLSDQDPYGAEPSGTFLNRVHSFEIKPETGAAQLVHFPKSCLHCEDAPCVTVCPTGALRFEAPSPELAEREAVSAEAEADALLAAAGH